MQGVAYCSQCAVLSSLLEAERIKSRRLEDALQRYVEWDGTVEHGAPLENQIAAHLDARMKTLIAWGYAQEPS